MDRIQKAKDTVISQASAKQAAQQPGKNADQDTMPDSDVIQAQNTHMPGGIDQMINDAVKNEENKP
ncbi:hypothetical protein F4779DRAFT_616077 [Xylariaceae sp. FL0662B]|nr:hypothetical protein F4779DRAFT_616077 [Xylariaceae sp. FL0662B]